LIYFYGINYQKNMKKNFNINIGIIGGSGIDELKNFKKVDELKIKTKYGYPSCRIKIYKFKDKNEEKFIAFLPRHGDNHLIPPHKIPYKANISAFKSLGVEFIISTFVAGSLKKKIKPGDFFIPDQFVNFTWGRDDYFDVDKKLIHLPMGEPYCKNLRHIIYTFARKTQKRIHKKGTVVVIQGSRFSTKAESKWFVKQGWDMVNMTQYPEVYFAREMKICYASLCSITDYDVGVSDSVQMNLNGIKRVLEIFQNNTQKTQDIIFKIIKEFNYLSLKEKCECKADLLEEYLLTDDRLYRLIKFLF